MPVELTLSNGGLLNFQPGLPPNYTGPRLSGAASFFAKTNSADIALQELAAEDYCIRLTNGKFTERVTATTEIKKEGLYSYFMLKNGMRKEIPSIGKMHIREEQFISFYTGPVPCKARFEKNKEFRSIDIFYSPKLLEELIPYFPELKNLSFSKGMLLGGKVSYALPSMKDITQKMFDRDFDDHTLQFYFDLKVRELLYEILQKTYKHTGIIYRFTPWETARIHDLKTVLETFIDKKPPTLRWLARKVALNSFKLKTGFSQIFHVGIFDWLMDKKMQQAKHLLLTTNDPIKYICKLVGYPRPSNFSTAFKRHFGMTPGSLRRK